MRVSGVTLSYRRFLKHALTHGNLEKDEFVMALTSAKYVPDLDKHESISDLTGEVSGGGYVRQKVVNPQLSTKDNTLIWSCDDVKFVADGGDLVCRYWVLFSQTSQLLFLAGSIFDAKKQKDTIVTDGNSLTIYCKQGLWELSLG